MRPIVLTFLLFFASIYAQSVSVWVLDEQLSSDNLTVLRFRVQNTGQQTIHGLELHYRTKQDWNGIAPAEAYYIPGGNTEWIQLGDGEALLKISFPNAVLEPMEELSNSSGFSVGLHTKDWSAWNKQEHYSQPTSGTFTLTDRISVYSNGVLLAGVEETVSNVACPEVWFLEIRTDSVKIGWMPSGNAEEQTTLELRSFSGASREVNLTQAADSGSYKEWSGAFPVQHQKHGELWLNCSGKMAAYFAYGLVPENANPAVKAGLWDDEYGFVKAHADPLYYGKSSGQPIEKHFPHGLNVGASGWPSIIPTMEFALKLSALDHLKYYSLLDKLEKGISDYKELFASSPRWHLLPPSPYTVIANIEAGIPMAIVQANQGYSGMHMMIIDGYKIEIDGSVYLHFVGTGNEGTSDWLYYASFYGLGVDVLANMVLQSISNLANLAFNLSLGANFYVAYYVPPTNASGRLTDSRIHQDSDGDGIFDFDEIERFGTNPNKIDSDGDGIPDKAEIEYYTRMGKPADIDKDGLRAELDVDSDGDGDCDGDENVNKNGRYEENLDEYNMMDSTSAHSTRKRCKTYDVALLATEQININDRAYCTDGSDYCPIVSMGLVGGNAVQMGVSAKAGSILAGSSVWLRSNAAVLGDIHAAGALLLQDATPQVFGAIRQNDPEAFMLSQVNRPSLSGFKINMGISGYRNIPSGQTVTLQPGNHRQNIVVSSGSVLRLRPGHYQMGSLTVQSGGKVELLESGNIALDIVGSFQWNGSFQGNSIQEAASRLRVRTLGNQDIFLNTSFGGFLVAPNAYVVVGQADKDHAGQIYAKRITVHQNTRFLWVIPGSWQGLNIAMLKRGYVYSSK